MLIATGRLRAGTLDGRVAIVTGGAGGIGLEAARALAWLGATVVIADVDAPRGREAEARLCAELPAARLAFVEADVADEGDVARLVDAAARLGPVDIVLNNAAVAHVGDPVVDTPIEAWDRSYGVNLRAPVLLARACLPSMIGRRAGVFVCVSSTGGPFLGAYETLKAAQVALGSTLDAELAGTGVTAFTIGPGLVPTATAAAAVERLAPALGLTLAEFYALNRGALLSVEAAGAGFAAAIAQASRYAGQEISSTQALVDAGIEIPPLTALPGGVVLPPPDADRVRGGPPAAAAVPLCRAVRATLATQVAGWHDRSFFERQWVTRDFKQRAGMPAERWIEKLERFEEELDRGDAAPRRPALERLAAYYDHLADLAAGYVKDPADRDKQVAIVLGWRDEVERLRASLG